MRFIRLLPVLFCGLLGSYRVTAQTTPADSARVSYGEEVLTQPLRVDTVALRVQREDRSMWKLGLNNFTVNNSYQRYGVHLAYERKLGRPAWSVLGEVSPAFLHSYGSYLSVRTQLAGRYYYNLERRIRQGRNAGNFSANYLSLTLGTSFGRVSDGPFSQNIIYGGQFARTQLALLYGLQRRLGKRGFIDANVGLAKTLTHQSYYNENLFITVGLRVGLVLSGALMDRPYVPTLTEGILLPKWYVGAHVSLYDYGLQRYNVYSGYNTNILAGPYLYVGRYLRPRLAVQVGLQYGRLKSTGYSYSQDQNQYRYVTTQYNGALPVLLRYALTRVPQQRLQVDLLAGAALVTTWSYYHRESYNFQTGQLTGTTSGRDHTYGIAPTLGLNVAYGFGRARRVQAVAEGVLIKPVVSRFYYNNVTPGLSLGLRYRFHYQ